MFDTCGYSTQNFQGIAGAIFATGASIEEETICGVEQATGRIGNPEDVIPFKTIESERGNICQENGACDDFTQTTHICCQGHHRFGFTGENNLKQVIGIATIDDDITCTEER
ncbi:hypothetical protein V144x_30010 [Gimesia aquarii]|uniref:Uncharacterized protein n=1 Tax=Gimesia aquarii TaxID=2527964 RepID=A0A517VWZ7_9PLAN|nr:hypothetical protein V144x_30010 [Gimesia aquarii]